MYCSQCGKENSNGATYCIGCGNALCSDMTYLKIWREKRERRKAVWAIVFGSLLFFGGATMLGGGIGFIIALVMFSIAMIFALLAKSKKTKKG